MHTPFQYRRQYTKSGLENIEKRKESYDKHGQHISVTLSPVAGDKLPLFVKLPRLSSYFRKFPPYTGYNNHGEGLFNGIYYLPRIFTYQELPMDTGSQLKYGELGTDMHDEVKTMGKFELLMRAYQDVAKNVTVSSQRQVSMKEQAFIHNYRTDQVLIDAGKSQCHLYISRN